MIFSVISDLFRKLALKIQRLPQDYQGNNLLRWSFFYIALLIVLLSFNVNLAQKPGDAVFEGNQVHTFVFHFDYPGYLDSLYQSNASSDYILGHLSINGISYDSVGVRFKGSSSFKNYPGNKKSFRVKFHEFKDHDFNGLRRINLNNGWSDPTMLREKIYLDFLFEQGIKAPRANFAAVYIDSLYWGFYTMVEQVDKTFLSHRYGENDGNLYKALGQSRLDWKGSDPENYYDYYRLKTNEKENNQSDLINLLDVINNSPNEFVKTSLNAIFEINEFIRAWSANNFIINMDSYFGSANNFYLYQNESTGKFNWILWDTNLTFGGRSDTDSLGIFWKPNIRPLINRLLYFEEYRDLYTHSLYQLIQNIDEQAMMDKIDSLFDFIKPFYFADTLKMYSNKQAEDNLTLTVDRNPGIKTFIGNRIRNVLKQLQPYITHISTSKRPTGFILHKNFPNPFNKSTVISYHLPVYSNVSLKVYDINGRLVKILVDELQRSGDYSVNLNASDLATGLYIYKLAGTNAVKMRKMMLIK